MENGLAVHGSFLAKNKSPGNHQNIFILKKVCIYMDIIVERLRRRPLFL